MNSLTGEEKASGHDCLTQRFSKCGPQTSRSSSIWERVKNAKFVGAGGPSPDLLNQTLKNGAETWAGTGFEACKPLDPVDMTQVNSSPAVSRQSSRSKQTPRLGVLTMEKAPEFPDVTRVP